MKFLIAGLLALCAVSVAVAAGGSKGALEAGDAAPAFSLTGSDGKTYELAEFKGKQAVVLAWFPKAFTGG
jgi:peroxiredoxin Q/BCP